MSRYLSSLLLWLSLLWLLLLRLLLVLTAVALFLPTILSAAEIYRWRDAQGRLHYGESIPDAAQYDQLDPATLPPVHAVPAPDVSTPVSAQPVKQQSPRTGKRNYRSAKENPAIKRCRRYQQQLETIQAKLRAGYREPTGNRLRAKRRQVEQRQRDEC